MKDSIWYTPALKYDDGPIAFGFPAETGLGFRSDEELQSDSNRYVGSAKRGQTRPIFTFGTTIPMAMEAAAAMEKQGYSIYVVNARFIKPLDEEMLLISFEQNIPILTDRRSGSSRRIWQRLWSLPMNIFLSCPDRTNGHYRPLY